jgi:hypothetical protein
MTQSRGGVVLKVFRQVFGGSLKDTQEAVSQLRQNGYEGTLVETELLRRQLQQEGVSSVLIRVARD